MSSLVNQEMRNRTKESNSALVHSFPSLMNSAVIFPHWHFLELFGGKRVSRIGQTRIKSVNQEMRNRNHGFSLLKNSTVTSRFWHFLEPFGGKRIGRIGQTRIKKCQVPSIRK